MQLGFCLIVSALCSWALCFGVYHVLHRVGSLDYPNERSSHTDPTVRGGGLAIVTTLLVGGTVVLPVDSVRWVVALGAMAFIAGISFWDDLRSLPSSVRFGCHTLAGFAVICAEIPGGALASLPLQAGMKALFITASFLWIVGYTNAFNFMDGINGIAGGQALVTSLGSIALIVAVSPDWHSPMASLSALVAGSALGFLPYNFWKGRMFMGDVGSAPLGFLCAGIALWIVLDLGLWLLIPLVLLHSNFVLDTGITLVRRILRGEKWYAAHREHFYQRLVRAGKSHLHVTLSEMGLQVVVLGLALCYVNSTVAGRILCATAVLVIWSAYFAYCEWSFRKVRFAMKCGDREIHRAPCVSPVPVRQLDPSHGE